MDHDEAVRSEPRRLKYDAVIDAPFGAVGVAVGSYAIRSIAFLPPSTPRRAPSDALAQRAVAQLESYFDDPKAPFDLPLAPTGTGFQRGVWDCIAAIPLGSTRSYGEIALELGAPARAVGQACGDNRYPLIIPCHRVVGAAGIGGFAHSTSGDLLQVKQWLLAHEIRLPLFAT